MTSISTPDIQPLRLAGAFEITLRPIGDERGYFMTTYHAALFRQHGMVTDWAQENQSLSARKGILRGLHFQLPPHTETKLVRVLSGAILDVMVDLRKASPTFGQWEAIELSAENRRMVYIPKGFAHGFCTLTDDVIVAYKVDAYYTPEAQAGLRWDDPTLAIRWPVQEPLLSPKDRALPDFASFESPF